MRKPGDERDAYQASDADPGNHAQGDLFDQDENEVGEGKYPGEQTCAVPGDEVRDRGMRVRAFMNSLRVKSSSPEANSRKVATTYQPCSAA